MNLTMNQITKLRGADVYSKDGDKIGAVDQVYIDKDTQQPEWLGIGTGFLRTQRALVPVQGAQIQNEDRVVVSYSKQQVKDSPTMGDPGSEISQSTEAELYSHYGLQYSERRSDSGLPEGSSGQTTRGTTRGTKGQEAITRHEEQLRVGKESVETGRLRLHKWVETEPVETDVELRRETATVEREPIDKPAPGAELTEEEVEVPLRGEKPMVKKETVAKERVKAEKGVDTRRERVSDTVRKERVEAEGEDVDTKKR
jgi:uncharacterized protein (TIGR02271 family)